jgi:hypothetical protein
MAINQNIFGYIAVDPIDWSKSANDLSKTLFEIGKGREDQKVALDQLKMDNLKLIQQSDSYSSQTFGQKFTTAAQMGRDNIKAWNDALKRGEITPDEYKLKMNNFTESWGLLGNSIKGFDQKYAELQKQMNNGDASMLTVEASQYFAKMGELKNLEVYIDPETGTVSTGRLDPATGKIIPESIESAKSIADPSNAVFDKVDLDKEINDISKTFGVVVNEQGMVTTQDARDNPAFQSKLIDIQNAMTSNNRLTASILMDNIGGGYTTYFTTQERDQKIYSMLQKENELRSRLGLDELSGEDLQEYIKDIESKLIPMQKDSSGVYQPMVSEEQITRAKEAIEDTLYMQLDLKRTEDEPVRVSYSAAGTGSRSEDLKFTTRAEKVLKNWNNAEYLTGLSKGKYIFEWNGNKLDVYTVDSERGGKKAKIASVGDATGIWPYIGIPSGQEDNWVKTINAFRPGTPKQPASTPKQPKVNQTPQKVKFN